MKINNNWIIKILNIKWIIYQYLSARNPATPAFIHLSSLSSVGISNIITKLVEWPVVESVPDLLNTLYTGVLYIPDVGTYLSDFGIKWSIGKSTNSFLGSESASMCLS